ncbi:MAG TPA: protein kinase [Verrucomicrobiae bacterium]|nr:protein kinase [Verrucomicrobiae bacterium]
MEASGWDRVEELFHHAADLAPAERAAFLDRACGRDAKLRREVESLLATDIPHDRLFQEVINRTIHRPPEEPEETCSMTGQRIGPYAITGLIGKGGMGDVYHAVREDDFRMPVAIKLLRRGAGTETALRRFRTERQILAGLQHPNIARLLDGGATDAGLPYLVMEYVEGAPLLEYAAALPVRERLELFRAVCSAVHYAHQRQIVHRDIKPANILVTADGIPKLLDFGIAKLLDPPGGAGGTATATGAQLMTPDYASPEQLRGEAVTVATDIYSLGAVLYDLLTGQKVNRVTQTCSSGGVEETDGERRQRRRAAEHLDPDLDRIVLKALHRAPEQRYASVEEFSEDLRRLLEDLPVQARRQSLLYRGRKFLRRNRLPVVAATAIALLSLALGMGLRRLGAPVPGLDANLRSIAVLPLENLSGDPGQEYFADGMTDALIGELARIRGLRVISRASTVAYKGARRRLPEIAHSLRVGTIAEGSVLRSGDRVRVALRLFDAVGDRPVWSGSYEGELRDVLAFQSQVAAAVAREIRVTLTATDRARASSDPRVNLDAYDTYLRGRQALFRSTVEDIQRAIQLFQQALGIEPNYALAYSGLAQSYITLSGMYLRPREAMSKAKAAAARALEIDPGVAEAHFSMGVVQGWYEFQWEQADREFKRAIELNPNDAMAHLWYGQSMISTGRAMEGVEQMRIAHDLDPLSAFVETGLGQMYFLSRQYPLAIQQLRSVTASDDTFIEGHTWLGAAYLYTNQYAEAVGELERARQLDPQQSQPMAYLAYAHARLGARQAADRLLRQLKELSHSRYISGYLFAIVCVGMNSDDAIDWLEKAYAERDDMLSWLKVDALFDPLRGEPRFQQLIRQVGLDSAAHL